MQFRTKLGLVDIPNEDVLRAASDIAPRVDGSHEPRPHAGALGVARGSLPGQSAEALASNWEDRAKGLQIQAAAAGSMELKGRLICSSDVFWLCARQLRRQMVAGNERQPEENTSGETRRGE